MKDGELSSSMNSKKKPMDPADMSLEELLKADLAQEPKPASLRRAAQGREDEPGSGLVKLAEMVAKSAQDPSGPFATISSVPPVPMMTPAGGIQVPEPSPVPAPAKRSSAVTVFAALIIAAAVLAGFYLIGNRQQPQDVQELESSAPVANSSLDARGAREDIATEVMAAKMAPADRNDAETASPAVPSPGDDDKQATPTAEQADADKTSAAETQAADDAEPKSTGDDKNKPALDSAKRAPRAVAAKTKERAPATPKSPPVNKNQETAAPKKEPAQAKEGGTADLDALLGGPKKKDKQAAEAAEKSDVLAQPNRQQVQKAMDSVARKAQRCAQYSTGTIQLKLVVNNGGRVVSSNALPPFAGTTAGKCVEMIARTAKFPEFSEPSFTVNYPIILK